MIEVPIGELQPGMIVARSVFGMGSHLGLAAGFSLDEAVIKRCKSMGMRSLWVNVEGEDIVPAGNVNDQLALQAQQAWSDNMELLQRVGETQDSTLESLTKFTSDPGRFKDIVATAKMKGIVDSIIKAILGQEPLVVNLASMRTADGYLYQHALDVTITAVMLASKLKFTQQEIQELALGCFLMDLGMIIVPKEITEKKGPLTLQEANLVREHPAVGYVILKANKEISINSMHVAYQHHERLDGSGFPRRLKGSGDFPKRSLSPETGTIHRFAEVAAVSDTYISAISPRVGTPALTPHAAMKLLIGEAGVKLNSHVVNALITLIPVFPAGTRIIVSKSPKTMLVGHVGVVSKANLVEKEKPQVLLMFDKFNRKLSPPILLDLAVEKDVELQFVPL